jgi:hypothetical protein
MKKTAQVDELDDLATKRLVEALWRAADAAFRLLQDDFAADQAGRRHRRRIRERTDSAVAADELADVVLEWDVEELGREGLFDLSEDLAKIAAAIADISDGVECPHCAWAAQFYQGRHPMVWGYIVELMGGRELKVMRDGEPRPWRTSRHATEETRYIGGIGTVARNLVKAAWGRRHLQGRHAEGHESENRRDKLDAIVRTERPSNWSTSVQLCSADFEPARGFIAHVAAEGIGHVKSALGSVVVDSELRSVWVTLPHHDDRFTEIPILELAPLRRALAIARRRGSGSISKSLVHDFLAALLETTPSTIAGQLKKGLPEFPSLPTINTNIDISR